MEDRQLRKSALIAEIVGGIAIVVSLAILIVEIRENTAILERRMAQDRAEAVSRDMIQSEDLAMILDKIKRVDGHGPHITSFMDKYELTAAESIRWNRHQHLIWQGLQADYKTGSEDVESVIRYAIQFPDNQLFIESLEDGLMDEEFLEFVRRIAAEAE